MTSRRILAAGIGVAVALVAAVVEYARTDSAGEAAKAFPAALVAVAVVGLVVTLPGITVRGAVIGGCFVVAGIFTWTYTDRPLVIWGVLGVAGVIFAVWGRPWLANARLLPGLGGAWIGLAYWILGVIGAGLAGHLSVAAQRVAYAGVFTLAALAVLSAVRRKGGGDPTVGIAAAILVGIAALLLIGSGSVFDSVHAVPDNASALLMRDRFWGGPGLYFHPNSLAGLVVIAAVRIGPDRLFAAWQRLSVTLLAGFVLFLTNSRIGFLFAGAAALVHAALLVRWRRPGLPDWRRPWLAAAVPFVVLALVFALSGGGGFLFKSRLSSASGATGDDVTSGRIQTWQQVGEDWLHGGVVEKVFGDVTTSRGVVTRTNDGAAPGAPRLKLNTDNAAVGAFRRGGVLGEVAFLFGLGLLVVHGVRRRAGAWFTIAVLSAVPTVATEDWLLGGTNGALWLVLLAGEAWLLYAARTTRSSPEVTATVPAAVG
jgi:hypothetical protein